MVLAGFTLLWFLLGVGCVLAGTILTYRRAARGQSGEPLVRRIVQGQEREKKGHRTRCTRCAQPLETGADARFCGACGLRLRDEQAG